MNFELLGTWHPSLYADGERGQVNGKGKEPDNWKGEGEYLFYVDADAKQLQPPVTTYLTVKTENT